MADITIVLSTDCKRPTKLLHCLKSIKKNIYKKYEVLVLQQSDTYIPLPVWVQTYRIPRKGVSFSKNIALALCKTDLIAFTDDDCIADPYWVTHLIQSFRDNKVDGVYGKVIPYRAAQSQNRFCPSYMLKDKQEIIDTFSLHRTHFGIGCNMAFRSAMLKQCGGFKQWLGPGVIGQAAEDIELLYRILEQHHPLMYNPEAIVYHDKWLSEDENHQQYYQYYRGMLAAYSYHMFRGSWGGLKTVLFFWKNKLHLMVRELCAFPDRPRAMLKAIGYDSIDIIHFMEGMSIGWYHSFFDRNDYRETHTYIKNIV